MPDARGGTLVAGGCAGCRSNASRRHRVALAPMATLPSIRFDHRASHPGVAAWIGGKAK